LAYTPYLRLLTSLFLVIFVNFFGEKYTPALVAAGTLGIELAIALSHHIAPRNKLLEFLFSIVLGGASLGAMYYVGQQALRCMAR
jgi:hypothetical protein